MSYKGFIQKGDFAVSEFTKLSVYVGDDFKKNVDELYNDLRFKKDSFEGYLKLFNEMIQFVITQNGKIVHTVPADGNYQDFKKIFYDFINDSHRGFYYYNGIATANDGNLCLEINEKENFRNIVDKFYLDCNYGVEGCLGKLEFVDNYIYACLYVNKEVIGKEKATGLITDIHNIFRQMINKYKSMIERVRFLNHYKFIIKNNEFIMKIKKKDINFQYLGYFISKQKKALILSNDNEIIIKGVM